MLTKLLAEQHKKHPSHGYYMLAIEVFEATGWVFSHNLAHKCCKQAGIRSKARKYTYKKPGEEHVEFPNEINGNWNATRPVEIVVSDMTIFKNNGRNWEWTLLVDTFKNEILAHKATPIQGSTKPYYHCLEQLKLLAGKKNEEQMPPVVLRTDQGVVYALHAFRQAHEQYNILRSMPRVGTPTDNAIIEAINGWIKEKLFLDFGLATTKDVPKLLDEYVITIITSDLRPLGAIKAQFSIKPNWASNSMVLFSVYFSLTDAIRFWQADGESEKTSIRTRTCLGQLVEAGHFKGGFVAYGYDLAKSGRLNKKKHELLDLQINKEEAAVVHLIFDKYTLEGYGAQRISTYLNNLGYRTRAGKNWHPASIRGILCNLTYTGVLRSGDSRSDVLPELQIISPQQFEMAQKIRENRSEHAKENPTVPLNTKGQSLLAGNVFCGHCGARLNLTTSGKYRRRGDGSMDKTPRIRYVCYGKTRKQTECDGPTGYTMHLLDDIIDKMVREIFRRMKGVSKNDLVQARYAKELNFRKTHMTAVKAELAKATETLNVLRAEIVRCIQGKSAFSQDTLAGLIRDSEAKCSELQTQFEEVEAAVMSEQQLLNQLTSQYEELISWADLYDHATFEAKKMIVNCLIRRVEVFRDYKLNVEFNFDLNQFLYGLDLSA